MRLWQCPSCTLRTVSDDTVASRVCYACRRWCDDISAVAADPDVVIIIVPPPPPAPKRPVILIEDCTAYATDDSYAAMLAEMVWN